MRAKRQIMGEKEGGETGRREREEREGGERGRREREERQREERQREETEGRDGARDRDDTPTHIEEKDKDRESALSP